MNQPSSYGERAREHVRNPWTLMNSASWVLVTSPGLIEYVLDLHLPSQMVISLFSSSLSALKGNYHVGLKPSIIKMLSCWPREELRPVDLVGEDMANALFVGSTGQMLAEWFMEGLLYTKKSSRLRKLDLSGFTIPQFFQLPLLWLPPEERVPERFIEEIHAKYEHFLTNEDRDMGAVLKWRLSQMGNSTAFGHFEGEGRIEVILDDVIELSQWMSICDVILALMMNATSPFIISLHDLAVNNYYRVDSKHLKWLLTMLDKRNLRRLGIHGKRKDVSSVFRDVHLELEKLTEIQWFMYSMTGPRPLRCIEDSTDHEDENLTLTANVFNSWNNLSELIIKRVALSGQVSKLFGALKNPLKSLLLYANWLLPEDLEFLSTYSGLREVEEFSLERSDLKNMGRYVAKIVMNLKSVKTLNLKETSLQAEEVVDIVSASQSCVYLDTLIILDSECMLPPAAYVVITELACRIPSLQMFYIFPFNHGPFEACRSDIEKECRRVLRKWKKELTLMF